MFDDAIEWLNDNSGAVQALAVIVLAVVTFFYMRSTGKIASETEQQTKSPAQQAEAATKMVDEVRDQREFEGRPVLELKRVSAPGDRSALFEHDQRNHVWCRIQNIGRSPALNIAAELVFEMGEFSGIQSLSSLGENAETNIVPLAVHMEEVSVDYGDKLINKYRSRRRVTYDGFDNLILDVLTVESLQ